MDPRHALHTPSELLMLTLNVRGLNAHREAVTHLAESTRADVLVLTETKVATRRLRGFSVA
jgi:hypothetical protein